MINNIINWYKTYKFDEIMTIIYVTLVFQHINDYNLISLTDQICFDYLNHLHTNNMSQQDNKQHYIGKTMTNQILIKR